MTQILTYSGKVFDPVNPIAADIRIEDIAHALAHQCRFSGHTIEHYSVAEHSVRVSGLLEDRGYPYRVQMWGLLHDASEAYLIDLPAPVKNGTPLGDAYRAVEAKLMEAVCRRFSLPSKEPAAVRLADKVLCATEARDLMPTNQAYWSKIGVKPLPSKIRPWAASAAERTFLGRYRALSGDQR